jgi:hypothetical protein
VSSGAEGPGGPDQRVTAGEDLVAPDVLLEAGEPRAAGHQRRVQGIDPDPPPEPVEGRVRQPRLLAAARGRAGLERPFRPSFSASLPPARGASWKEA